MVVKSRKDISCKELTIHKLLDDNAGVLIKKRFRKMIWFSLRVLHVSLVIYIS